MCPADFDSSAGRGGRREIAAATALRRLGQPDDIAAVAAFLASDDGRWVTGQYVEASGGFDLVAVR